MLKKKITENFWGKALGMSHPSLKKKREKKQIELTVDDNNVN